MEITKIGKLLIEGKTKRVFDLNGDHVFVLSKDRITAGDGLKSHEMIGKSVLSTKTNAAIFEFLNAVGVPTAFVSRVAESNPDSDRSFVAKNCQMVPIEWVARRLATGSFLKRNPNVEEGHRFAPPKLETFFKDDANHDPYWSEESIIGAKLELNGVLIGVSHVTQMMSITRLVFELLERVWSSRDHQLVDMKIEFGVTTSGQIVVADVIDNDSWRLWPSGDKKKMLDKQIYRNLKAEDIDQKALDSVKNKFEIVAKRTEELFHSVLNRITDGPEVAIIIGSASDRTHAQKIKESLQKFGIKSIESHVSSAHKATQWTLDVVSGLQQWPSLKAIIACAGLSNGLGPVISGNACAPVINCPPITSSSDGLNLDIWSSLRMPSGMGCSTVIGAENAGLAAAQIVANMCPLVWGRVRCAQNQNLIKILNEI